MKKKLLLLFIGLSFLVSCTVTRPQLNYSGGNYNSVSDDIIIYNSTQEAIIKLANSLNPNDKILLVQIIDNETNDYIADRVFEELFKRNYVVGLAKRDELKTMNTEVFDKFLMFYPIVFGTETAATSPSFWTKSVSFIPIVGWIIGQAVIAKYTYIDRQAGVSIHTRLVDATTGDLLWIKQFTGQDKIRLEGGGKQKMILTD